jgi:hypothetical protein
LLHVVFPSRLCSGPSFPGGAAAQTWRQVSSLTVVRAPLRYRDGAKSPNQREENR